MGTLLIQLSDLHAKTGKEPVLSRVDAIVKAIVAELNTDVDTSVLIFNGDAAHAGRVEEFKFVSAFLLAIKSQLLAAKPGMAVHLLSVPGNHDLDFSGDQDARGILRHKVGSTAPAPSTAQVLLEPQSAYFSFAKTVGDKGSELTIDAPYYRHVDIITAERRVRFNLINSSWTSVLHEGDDLRYPLASFAPPKDQVPDYSVTVLHHPIHWFIMPGVRRELRHAIESLSDLVLTGHEHANETSRRKVHEGGEINYQEGGVLHDGGQPNLCSFTVISLNFQQDKQVVKRLTWRDDHFEPDGEPQESSILSNPLRRDRRLRLTVSFEQWLDELEDPLTHPRASDLRLSHLFSYPELRKIIETADDDGGKSSQLVERVRSENIVTELLGQSRIFITGGDKSGKTSMLKRLFVDAHAAGRVPLLVKGGEIAKSGSEEGLRRHIEKAVKHQYQMLSPAEFEQLNAADKMVLVDDLHDGPGDPRARRRVLDYLGDRFGNVTLFASDDLYLELVDRHAEDAAALLPYQRYEIRDFGNVRFQELALRWNSLGRSDADPAELQQTTRELCEKVESLLAVAGLPHTPWLLVVLLEHEGTPDATVAAKNGDYGHLYHAVITVRLSRSKFISFNLNGKFSYLSELAYQLYRSNSATISESDARKFHKDYSERFDLTFDYEKVRDDLIETRMLRLDGDELAFRHKYVFSFFVAWWLHRNLHKPEAEKAIAELCGRLHHDVSANVLVFLAHHTDNPAVLEQMLTAAAGLFAKDAPAQMTDEVKPLNELDGVEGFFALPSTAPEVNRKLLNDAKDEHSAKREKHSQDGRAVQIVPDESRVQDELQRRLREIRAAVRTIRILGQVLRNKSQSAEGPEKQALMEQVLGVGRRLLGHLYSAMDDMPSMVRFIRARLMRSAVEDKVAAEAAGLKEAELEVVATLDEDSFVATPKLEREALREIWDECTIMSNRFWFDMYWMASWSVIKRLAEAVGSKDLDPTMDKVRSKDSALPNHLVQLAARLNRRGRSIPADEMVRLHKDLSAADNKLPRVVLEAMAWERLLLYETDPKKKQQICSQMGIKVPIKSLDQTRKKFTASKVVK